MNRDDGLQRAVRGLGELVAFRVRLVRRGRAPLADNWMPPNQAAVVPLAPHTGPPTGTVAVVREHGRACRDRLAGKEGRARNTQPSQLAQTSPAGNGRASLLHHSLLHHRSTQGRPPWLRRHYRFELQTWD